MTYTLGMFLTLFVSAVAFAGVSSSGGGGAVVCYDGQKIKSAELFDIAEALALEGHLVQAQSTQDWPVTLNEKLKALSRTGFGFSGLDVLSLETVAQWVLENRQFIPKDKKLDLTEDNKPTFALSAGCKMEQAATYVDDTKMLFDARIWEALSNNSKAALVLHEILYRIDRGYKKMADSTRIRKVVAAAFREKTPITDMLSTIPQTHLLCHTSSTGTIWLFHNLTAFTLIQENDKLRLRFFVVGGDPLISDAEATLPLSAWKFFDPDFAITNSMELNFATQSLFETQDALRMKSYPAGQNYQMFFEGYRTSNARLLPSTPVSCKKVE